MLKNTLKQRGNRVLPQLNSLSKLKVTLQLSKQTTFFCSSPGSYVSLKIQKESPDFYKTATDDKQSRFDITYTHFQNNSSKFFDTIHLKLVLSTNSLNGKKIYKVRNAMPERNSYCEENPASEDSHAWDPCYQNYLYQTLK